MMLEGRRVLVTGASGAIGPAVVRACQRAGAAVRTLNRSTAGETPGVDAYVGDVTRPDTLAAAMFGVDSVVHMAGLLHITEPSAALNDRYTAINERGTSNVVIACERAGVARLVYTSTVAVYGPTREGQPPRTEDDPPRPETAYARTKLAGEAHVVGCRSGGREAGVVLRLAAVYGPGVKGNYARLIRAIDRGFYVGVGKGRNRRTLVHESDAAAAIVLAIASADAAGGTFNVTDGAVHDVASIVAAIASALHRRPPRVSVPLPLARGVASAVAGAFRSMGKRPPVTTETLDKLTEDVAVDGSRAQRILGFAPQYDLRLGWQQVVQRMREEGALPHRSHQG